MSRFIYKLDNIKAAARWVLSQATGYTIIAFEGEMGAGKTTLVQKLCIELGVADSVVSPTYSIVNEYIDSQKKQIYHFDLYRLQNEEEAIGVGFFEYIDSGKLCLIEWPQKLSNILSKEKVLYITIEKTEEEERVLRIN